MYKVHHHYLSAPPLKLTLSNKELIVGMHCFDAECIDVKYGGVSIDYYPQLVGSWNMRRLEYFITSTVHFYFTHLQQIFIVVMGHILVYGHISGADWR